MVTNTDSMYYEGEVCLHSGRAWAIELVEIEPTPDGRRRWDARALCLGKEGDILPILRGKAPIPEGIHPRRKAVLRGILERGQNERADREATNTKVKSTRGQRSVRSGGLRAGPASHTKYKPVNTRPSKIR